MVKRIRKKKNIKKILKKNLRYRIISRMNENSLIFSPFFIHEEIFPLFLFCSHLSHGPICLS